ncbi:DUF1836 domain-containing protein [Psychrobacillus sp. INOP01]|uniref:DUF1836 domain-containing protein n=1 Tax=Psychrobacillus sp. INOP01 TaxID=2829187 RepID=UPI001BAD11F9|nr:DUF1836 domain-containing protein [Psychrobacillus sp. INOP01]QUG41543.1 DUF1836 domain-containing protein [Psychrobacillus sp. INOP01]
MSKSEEITQKLGLESTIHEADIPTIDLYMDQVIQLFDATYNESLRNEDEKVLTKTMINNYAKGKLFIPIKNKKYSKDHIMMISLIYQLKGALSIKDIKSVLEPINEKIDEGFPLEKFYNSWVKLQQKNAQNFLEEMKSHEVEVENQETEEIDKLILLIASLSNMSNAYRKAAELLVDELTERRKGTK